MSPPAPLPIGPTTEVWRAMSQAERERFLIQVNDALSEKIYGLFLERLDGSRRWLTQADVKQLEAWKLKLDNEANEGTFAFLDLATQLPEAGIRKTQAWYRELLSQPFDFKPDE